VGPPPPHPTPDYVRGYAKTKDMIIFLTYPYILNMNQKINSIQYVADPEKIFMD
jgi:hypothetical protein